MIQDGVYIEDMDAMSASAMVACGMVASSIPLEPPLEWFENPKLRKATPLTILDDGRVFGHIAAWHVDHIGMSFGTKPPRSRSQYAYFHTGTLKTEEGVQMPVGQLTLAGGHAGLEADAAAAVKHYDDTASAFADVHAGEDAFGIWVAGALRPGTTQSKSELPVHRLLLVTGVRLMVALSWWRCARLMSLGSQLLVQELPLDRCSPWLLPEPVSWLR